ncbi:MAG: zinc ribbon domain-containing protein [Syntrophobacteraceae bacterium]
MPIYEFQCASCDNIEEFILTGSRQIEMKCSACGGEELHRIMSRTNYAMGQSSSSDTAGPCATTRSCGPGKSCTSIELPGHAK